MVSLLMRALACAGVLMLLGNVSDGAIKVEGFGAALLTAALLGLANATIKPVLLWLAKVATCALNCVTLGLSTLLISWLLSGALFYWIGQAPALTGFRVERFSAALWGALAVSLANALVTVALGKDEDENKREER